MVAGVAKTALIGKSSWHWCVSTGVTGGPWKSWFVGTGREKWICLCWVRRQMATFGCMFGSFWWRSCPVGELCHCQYWIVWCTAVQSPRFLSLVLVRDPANKVQMVFIHSHQHSFSGNRFLAILAGKCWFGATLLGWSSVFDWWLGGGFGCLCGLWSQLPSLLSGTFDKHWVGQVVSLSSPISDKVY